PQRQDVGLMNLLNCSSASNLRPDFKERSLTVSELPSSNQSSEQLSLPRGKIEGKDRAAVRWSTRNFMISNEGGEALILERGEVLGDAKGSKILAVSMDTARLAQGVT